MFDDFDKKAKYISEQRRECVTPRGVLSKIYDIVQNLGKDGGIQKDDITANGFSWFY